LITRARERTRAAGLRVDYHVLDATREEEVAALGEGSFDAAVCSMGLMDISDVRPLFRALSRLLTPAGRCVFSVVHPESAGLAVASTDQPLVHIGRPGQPMRHYYFHRPLPLLLQEAERAGLAMDAELEIGLDGTSEGQATGLPSAFLVGRLVRKRTD
jgi:SAM-dependent methyltransferase